MNSRDIWKATSSNQTIAGLSTIRCTGVKTNRTRVKKQNCILKRNDLPSRGGEALLNLLEKQFPFQQLPTRLQVAYTLK